MISVINFLLNEAYQRGDAKLSENQVQFLKILVVIDDRVLQFCKQ